MSFYPDTAAPVDALLDRMETLLRSGDALIHDPLPPAWAAGAVCPSGHYCVPAGARLYRYDVPDECEADTVIAIGCDQDMTQRHLEDDRYWLVALTVIVLQGRHTEISGNAPALVRDLAQLFQVDTEVQTAAARLCKAAGSGVPGVHVFYLQEMDVKPDAMLAGRHGHVITFTAFCSGIKPT